MLLCHPGPEKKVWELGPIPRLFQKSGMKFPDFWTHYCLLIMKIMEFYGLNDS